MCMYVDEVLDADTCRPTLLAHHRLTYVLEDSYTEKTHTKKTDRQTDKNSVTGISFAKLGKGVDLHCNSAIQLFIYKCANKILVVSCVASDSLTECCTVYSSASVHGTTFKFSCAYNIHFVDYVGFWISFPFAPVNNVSSATTYR